MFVLRQLSSKINTAYVSMTMVCLMLFISVSTLSSGMGLSNSIAEELRKSAPFDATISTFAKTDSKGKPTTGYPGINLVDTIKKEGIGLNSFSASHLEVRYYTIEKTVSVEVVENNFPETKTLDSYLITLSDYNKILEKEGIAPITLPPGRYAVNSPISNAAYSDAIKQYMANADTITVSGTKLRTTPEDLYRHTLEVSQNEDYRLTFIVPDALASGLPVFRDVLHIDYPEQTEQYEELCQSALAKLGFGANIETNFETRVSVTQYSNSATILISYLAVYLGIVFLITAAAVLAIGQLSETSDNINRYGLLRKLGTEDKMINKALFTQILIYFGVPMLLALAHTTVGINFVSQLVATFDQGDILGSSLVTAAILLAVYGGYFLATYFGGKGILRRDYALRQYDE
jgi:putative ABC transport system permease protein